MAIENLLMTVVSQAQMERGSISIVDVVQDAGFVARCVLGFLCLMSVISWGIMIHKFRLFLRLGKDTRAFMEVFSRRGHLEQVYNFAKRLKNCPMARVFLAGYIELARQFQISQSDSGGEDEELLLEKLDSISRSLERATAQEVTKLESWLIMLGTTGSTAPFIGLFGTVWGIMEAFAQIGITGAASVAVVAPGISEALIATAAGLFSAIPAVIGYNYFVYRVKIEATNMDNFSLDMLSLIDRVYIKKSTAS